MSRREKQTSGQAEKALPLSYARTLSWLSLLFILLTSLGLSFFIASSVRQTLLRGQEDFSRLLAENLNSQIYRRFALPTFLANGRISLRQPSQYESLDKVVQSAIEGLPVEKLRIFDFSHTVAYSTSKEELGKMGLAPPNLNAVLSGVQPESEIIASMSPWQAWFHFPLPEGAFLLRVLYPLRGEVVGTGQPTMVMGALEFTQDITDDYERVMAFQGIIVVMCLLSSVILFGVLLMLIQRAERVLAERVLHNKKLEDEIHSNEKLVSMGRVVASIAHEIRNPLGIIRSSAQLLQKRMTESDKGTSRILGAIYDESVRLSQTVNDFLDYAKPRAPKKEAVDANLVLQQVLAFLEGDLDRRNVEVANEIGPGLYVLGDKDLLYRAFYNILVNAVQAMDSGGSITIRSCADSELRQIEVKSDAEALVCLEFADSGPGFDESSMASLLDPFFTTKDDGTGLGLPIVHSIIAGHGGYLELANSDHGAVVKVWLPLASKEQDSE